MTRNTNGFKYTVRSSHGSNERLLPLRVKPNRGSTGDYFWITVSVLTFFVIVLIMYWGYVILAEPKLQLLLHALGG